MNILLISECSKKALTETRRILDQFAERRGERTWQTPITQAGLDTLHRLLRKTARKNTAVACHWVRGQNNTELLWIVGDRQSFNAQGATPTNTTQRNILRAQDENDWHTGDLIRLLADIAGLMHDLGKAIDAFQNRLFKPKYPLERNLIRHEWVSLRLFEAFVGTDDDAAWLKRLANPNPEDDARWMHSLHLKRDTPQSHHESPFKTLSQAPLAQAIGWLIVTHHRLPQFPDKKDFREAYLKNYLNHFGPAWNEKEFKNPDRLSKDFAPYWKFTNDLPVTTPEWRKRASRLSVRLQEKVAHHETVDLLNNPYVMHLSRLSLMLADHYYSQLETANGSDITAHPERISLKHPNKNLIANTQRKTGKPNQTLDEHLIGVAQHAAEIARFLPKFDKELPHLGLVKKLKQRTNIERFRWQNKSADLAVSMRERSREQGAFIVNMASTGCGKTLANARIMHGLSTPDTGMRCAFALGLRTLTLQTGRAFRKELNLSDEDVALLVGGSASRHLFEHDEAEAERTGSASRQGLIEEDTTVRFEGMVDKHPLLRRAIHDSNVRKILLAPLLVCTIDHLTPATESQRGGRQIAPMLRLMSGDLVLDEPDDFGLDDFPALTRLVHWAGLLGARVLLSSATLPPALVQGLFEAYRNGRCHFQHNRSERASHAAKIPNICCAWIDEFQQEQIDCADELSFETAHRRFAEKRHAALTQIAKDQPRRRAKIIPVRFDLLPHPNKHQVACAFAPQVLAAAFELHQNHHSIDPHSKTKDTSKRVSFGLIRMANIELIYDVALTIFKQIIPKNFRIHLCVYHSQHTLLVRSAIERQLDATLQRHMPDAVFDLPAIRQQLDNAPSVTDHLFIVLGSPVTEVGRDHDYDWAVVEPSSMRSIIQLAGRVKRHRVDAVIHPNIYLFNRNLRSIYSPGKAAFCRPGFEKNDGEFHLESHDLETILKPEEIDIIDARPRLLSRDPDQFSPNKNLVDLEHACIRDMMLPKVAPPTNSRRLASAPVSKLNAATWWKETPTDTLLSAEIQRQQRFRDDNGKKEIELVMLPDEDEEHELLYRIDEASTRKFPRTSIYVEDNQRLHRIADTEIQNPHILPWGPNDYMEALRQLASDLDEGKTLNEYAKKFGTVTVPDNENGWRYHPVLGFGKNRES
jgi:CRISPR-associated endonuclease/helicase Cas3